MQVNVVAASAQSVSLSEAMVPAGIWSVTTIPAGTSDGPLFVTVMVKVVDDPGLTLVTPSVLVIDRSATGVTVVVWLAVLLASTASDVDADTTAVSVINPSIVVVTTIELVAVVPTGITPSAHVTTPDAWVQLPWLGVAATNATEPGRVSVTTTPAASAGPTLVTVSVYVTSSPAWTGSGRSLFVMARSAVVVTRSVSVAESSVRSTSLIGLNEMPAVLTSVGDPYPDGMKRVSWYDTEPLGEIGAIVVQVNVPLAITQLGSISDAIVPAGIASDTIAPVNSVEGPSFVNVIVYVVKVPAATEATPSVFVTTMSTAGSTIVDSASVLLAGAGSAVVEVTCAVSV